MRAPSSHTALPDPHTEPDLLARVELGGEPETPLSGLFAAIDMRATHAATGSPRGVPTEAVVGALARAAQLEGASLAVIRDEPRRAGIVALVEQGDRLQFADPRWRRELAAWMHRDARARGSPRRPLAEVLESRRP